MEIWQHGSLPLRTHDRLHGASTATLLRLYSNKPPPSDTLVPASQKSVSQLMNELVNSGASASTIVLAQQIVDSSNSAGDMLHEIEQLRSLRDTIQQRANELRILRAFVKKHGDDGEIDATTFLKKLPSLLKDNPDLMRNYPELATYPDAFANRDPHPLVPNKLTSEFWNKWCGVLEDTLLAQYTFSQDTVTGHVETDKAGAFSVRGGLIDDQLFDAAEKHKGDIQSLDSIKEITTMRLQETIQRKQRTITLATNIADASHRGQEAIIKNTRT